MPFQHGCFEVLYDTPHTRYIQVKGPHPIGTVKSLMVPIRPASLMFPERVVEHLNRCFARDTRELVEALRRHFELPIADEEPMF